MTELNNYPETDTHPAGVSWPAVPAGAVNGAGNIAGGPGGNQVDDASVAAVLDRLAGIPGLPVAGPAEAYASLHDALLDALNDANLPAAGDA